ncbi:hypothetical protein NQD34_017420 [Periophthalmus magnuspinnatus]|nr:hypothetical protein NQD34_017420 [Periophthalmus magnuspinnatus]
MKYFPDEWCWCRTSPAHHPTDWTTLLCCCCFCLFGSTSSRGPPSVVELAPIMVMGHMPGSPQGYITLGQCLIITVDCCRHTYQACAVDVVNPSRIVQSSFVCAQLFRPGACIVQPGSLLVFL